MSYERQIWEQEPNYSDEWPEAITASAAIAAKADTEVAALRDELERAYKDVDEALDFLAGRDEWDDGDDFWTAVTEARDVLYGTRTRRANIRNCE